MATAVRPSLSSQAISLHLHQGSSGSGSGYGSTLRCWITLGSKTTQKNTGCPISGSQGRPVWRHSQSHPQSQRQWDLSARLLILLDQPGNTQTPSLFETPTIYPFTFSSFAFIFPVVLCFFFFFQFSHQYFLFLSPILLSSIISSAVPTRKHRFLATA